MIATSYHALLSRLLVTQSCLTLCDPMDCSPTGSSVHVILQARMLEWVAISSSRQSSQPRGSNQFPTLQAYSEPLEKPIVKAKVCLKEG